MSRKPKFNGEDFLRAVRRTNTLSSGPIAKYLGVGKTTVYDWMQKDENKPWVEKAKEYLASFNVDNFTAAKLTWEIYQNLPKIREWKEAMDLRMVSTQKQKAWMRIFFNLCVHLKKIPGKITLEECAKFVVITRNQYYADEPQTPGLAYSRVREAVRGYYMSVENVSAMHLTNLGVGKEALKGDGKYARQLVEQPVRHRYRDLLIEEMKVKGDLKFFETYGNSLFCFSTGTRISASLAFNFKKHQYNLQKHKWMFEIWDKGSRGKKLRWEKIFMGDLLKLFKQYCSRRFDIPIDELEGRLPHETEYLFPSFVNDPAKIRAIIKPTLIRAGIPYQDFPPTHIWRHTFAQCFLKASNYNYELCCSLGGWKNSMILKKHYGAMGELAREQGLLRAMGEEIKQVIEPLQW